MITSQVVFGDIGKQPMANQDIRDMHKAGFSEGVILHAIRTNGGSFDCSGGELANLRKAGVGENVIAAMAVAGRKPALHLRLLDEGVYVKRDGAYALVNPEPVFWRSVSASPQAGNSRFAQLEVFGRVPNRASRLSLRTPAELLIVCYSPRCGFQYQLFAADVKSEHREYRGEAALLDGRLLGLSGVGGSVERAELDDSFDLGLRIRLVSVPKGEYGLIGPGVIVNGHVSDESRIYTFAIE